MFPFLNILQHYIEFDINIIATLEKLLDVGSFNGYIDHLTCCKTIFLVFSGGLDLFSIVWTIVCTFLGCWTLIVLTFVSCF
jgi:hypothetical protein